MGRKKDYDYEGIIVALLEIIDNHGIRALPAKTGLLALNDARAIARRQKQVGRIDYGWWLTTWNENCGELPKLRGLSDRRKQAIRSFARQVGSPKEAGALYLDAIKMVASDPWWKGENPDKKKYGFDNLVPNKIFRKAEEYAARQEIPNSEAPKFKVGQKVKVLGFLDGKVAKAGFAGVLVEFEGGKQGNYRLDEVEPVE